MGSFADFGAHAGKYEAGRRGYPDKIFLFLKLYVGLEEPILDLGCGTGIATRQLVFAGYEDVQGIDIDERMIAEAQSHHQAKHIPYWTGPVFKMPFRSGKFRALTAFSSFHWFQDKPSILEIRRVLKKKGFLFLCRKEDRSTWLQEIRDAIEKATSTAYQLPAFEESKKILSEGKFIIEIEKEFPGEDLYSLETARDYVQSISHWSLVPKESKESVMDEVIMPILQSHLTEKGLIRNYRACIILAVKQD